MRALLIIFILLGGITSPADSARAAENPCEIEAHIGIQTLLHYTQTLMKSGTLSSEDVMRMASGETITNPFFGRARSMENLDPARGMARAIRAVRGHEAIVKLKLRHLAQEAGAKLSQVEAAKASTKTVIAPQIISEILRQDDSRSRKIHWHRQADGSLEIAVYFPAKRELRVYSPYSREPKFARDLIPASPANVFTDNVTDSSDFLTTRDGRLFVAGTVKANGVRKLLVHDVLNNKTFEKVFPKFIDYAKLYENAFTGIHLVVTSGNSIHRFTLKAEIEEQPGELQFANHITGKELLAHGAVRNVLMVNEGRSFHLIDLCDGRILRSYKANTKYSSARAVLSGTEHYAIAVETRHPSLKHGRKIEFLTSKSNDVILAQQTTNPMGMGHWHRTQTGRLLFPIAVSESQTQSRIEIFEPLSSTPERKIQLWPPKLKTTLAPVKVLPTSPFYEWSKMNWFEAGGKIFIGHAFETGDLGNSVLNIISLNTGRPAFDTSKMEFGLAFQYMIATASGHHVLIANQGAGIPLRVFDLQSGERMSVEIQSEQNLTTPLVRNNNGDILFASDNSAGDKGVPIQIIRVTREE